MTSTADAEPLARYVKPPAREPTVFSISRVRQIEILLGSTIVALFALAIVVALFLPAWLALQDSKPNWTSRLPSLGVCVLVTSVAALVIYMLASSCRFTLRIDQERLAFGSRFSRSVMRCEDVETIDFHWEHIGKLGMYSLQVLGNKKTWKLLLDRNSLACCHALQQVCRHAVVRGPNNMECVHAEPSKDARLTWNRGRASLREERDSFWGLACVVTITIGLMIVSLEWSLLHRGLFWATLAVACVVLGGKHIRQRLRSRSACQ